MSTPESSKSILRYFIRDAFGSDPEIKEMCNSKTRVCRGGSRALYNRIISSKGIDEWMDTKNLQIISGLGHTFLRYYDEPHKQYIYIDSTIGQFVPSYDGIFVGDEKDLRELTLTPKSRLDLGDYLGPDYEGKKYPLPPLIIETQMMNEEKRKLGTAGGRRKRTRRHKRTRRRKRT
jgi:hypothetical protein